MNSHSLINLRFVTKMGALLLLVLCSLFALMQPNPAVAAPVASDLLAPLAGITTTLTINTVGDGGVTVVPPPPYNYGQVVTLSATPNGDATFTGWTGDVGHPTNWFPAYKVMHYRVGVDVRANGYPRTDKPAELALNFTTLFANLGQAGATFAPESLRVAEINLAGQTIDTDIPWQFDRVSNYNAKTNAAGTLTFMLKGNTTASAVRRYQIYFDVSGKGFTAPQFTDQVVRVAIPSHFGQAAYEFQTPNGKYLYHRAGGGFASLVDRDRNDWISYSTQPGDGGDFRGIPNAVFPEGYFHPGRDTAITNSIGSGPLKETIRSTAGGNTWEVIWEIFPNYARMTMVRSTHDYWMLYEGTPGGVLETAQDMWTRSDGQTKTLVNQWTQDLTGPEWIYFSDPDVEGASTAARSLFLAQHQENTWTDSYYPSGGLMTVFGFGRSGTNRFITTVPQQFTIGLMETTEFSAATSLINNAYRDLAISVLGAEHVAEVANPDLNLTTPFTVTMTSNRSITANFD